MSDSVNTTSTFKDNGMDVPDMPNLSDIPKPPLRRDVASSVSNMGQTEERAASPMPAPPPRPDMAPNRPLFAAPMPPASSTNEHMPSSEASIIPSPPPLTATELAPPAAVETGSSVTQKTESNDLYPFIVEKKDMIPLSSAKDQVESGAMKTDDVIARKPQDPMPQSHMRAPEVDEHSYSQLLASPPPSFPTSQTQAGGSTTINQGVFDEVLKQHEAWLQSDGKEGRRANLYGLDLRQINFANANLQQANLRGAQFDGADLSYALLNDADLTEASLRKCRASGANWIHVNLASASLQHAVLDGTDLSLANAIGANFAGASFKNATLQQINLRDATITDVDFTDADMSESICRGGDFSKAKFIRTVVTRADMRETICHACEFVETVLNGTNFRNAQFDNTSFSQANFSVALDIPLEYQNAGFQIEKENIENEKNELKQMQASIQQKQAEVMEMKLQMEEQRNLILSLKADETIYISGMEKIRSRLKIVRLLWIITLLLLVAVTGLTVASMPFDQLNVVELGVVFSVPVCVLLLIMFTLGQVSSALKRVGHHSMIRERKIASLQQSSDVTGKKIDG